MRLLRPGDFNPSQFVCRVAYPDGNSEEVWYMHNDDPRQEFDQSQVAVHYCRDKQFRGLRVSFEPEPLDPANLPDCAENDKSTPCTYHDSPLVLTPETSQPSVYYPNCAAARAAGAAPLWRGEPGYGTHLDRDGDGIPCEK
jgi:hypothetical protein